MTRALTSPPGHHIVYDEKQVAYTQKDEQRSDQIHSHQIEIRDGIHSKSQPVDNKDGNVEKHRYYITKEVNNDLV